MEFLLCVLGMVMVIEGLPYFGFPDRMKALMRTLQEQDDATLRIFGAVLIALGLLVVYLAKGGLPSE
jgi:uncharacterized protein